MEFRMAMFFLLLASMLTCPVVWSSVRRHNVLPSCYLETSDQYGAVGSLIKSSSGAILCTAFLVDTPLYPSLRGRVILSAAHCLRANDLYFSGMSRSSKILFTFLRDVEHNQPSLCSSSDVGLALISSKRQIDSPPLKLFLGDTSVSSFYGAILRNIGFGLTGRGDISILYEDGKKRLIQSKILNPEDARFVSGRFLATSFSDPETSGLPSFGDCGAPGIAIKDGSETVISIVSCLVGPRTKIIVPSQILLSDCSAEIFPVSAITRDELGNEVFMDKFLLSIGGLLNKTGEQIRSFYDGSWSYQIYLTFHKEWISKTFQRMSLLPVVCTHDEWSYFSENY